jgi:Fe-S-cluster containining protein
MGMVWAPPHRVTPVNLVAQVAQRCTDARHRALREEVIAFALKQRELIKRIACMVLKPLASGDRETAIRLVNTVCDEVLSSTDRADLQEIACKRGCYWCCHVEVKAHRDEVFRIARTLKRRHNAEQLVELKGRAAAWETEFRRDGRALCPLNVNGECSIYDHRPLACRGFNSADALKCQRAYERCFALGSGAPVHSLPMAVMVCGDIAFGLAKSFLDIGSAQQRHVVLAPRYQGFCDDVRT